jgi:WD40 repeat protein
MPKRGCEYKESQPGAKRAKCSPVSPEVDCAKAWLNQGPVPIPGICDMIADFLYKFKGESDGQISPQVALALAPIGYGKLVMHLPGGNVDVFDVHTGQRLATLENQTKHLAPLVVIPTDEDEPGRVAMGYGDRIRVLQVTDNTVSVLSELTGHNSHVNILTTLPGGKLASAAHNGETRVWDTTDGTCLTMPLGHVWPVNALVALPDSKLASGSMDRTLRVWNTDGTHVFTRPHADSVTALAVLRGGKLVSGSLDRTVRVWSVTGECEQVLMGYHARPFHSLAVLDGTICAASNYGTTLETWSEDGINKPVVAAHTAALAFVRGLPDGKVLTAAYDGTVCVVDLKTGEFVTLPDTTRSVHRVVVVSDGPNSNKYSLVTSEDRGVYKYS